MNALYSGFSYAASGLSYGANELRRAAQPAIDTLAPILPTFGCGEAAVKQSVGSCIHEMEAEAIANHHVLENAMGWSASFSNVKRIVLYPLQDPAGSFDQKDNCRDSTGPEMGMMANVTRNINEQLASWRIPFRFEISDYYMSKAEVLTKEANHCLSSNPKKGKMALAFAHCDSLQLEGTSVGGYQGKCHLALLSGQRGSIIAHELAHIFSPHAFEAIPLSSLHPDVLEAMCDGGAHGHELITSLSYWDRCHDAGYPDTLTHLQNSRGQWGPLDLTLAKLATHPKRDATHAQIHAEGVDQCYEWIRQNYGPRIAEQFVGSFVKSLFVHTMSAAIARSISDKRLLRISRVAIHMLGNLLQLGMLGTTTRNPWLALGYMFGGMTLMGKTVRALIDVSGDGAILRAFYHLMRGNSDAMLQLVYATCGTAAGNAFSQLIVGFIEMCAPTDASQRNAYIELSKPSGHYGVLMDEAFRLPQDFAEYLKSKQTSDAPGSPARPVETVRRELPWVIKSIITIDRAVADVITTYVSLHALTSWLWKTDQQKADAQVQASVDRLSATLDEVKSKFGPSDLPRVPTNTRSFRPTEPAPPLNLDATDDDDPLLMTEGAAVTGIRNASIPEKQPQARKKKQQ